jgi:hypothetical protein
MTFDELVELAKRRLSAGSVPPRVWSDAELDLSACVSAAARELASEVMYDDTRRAWLQQDYPVPLDPVTNEGDLLTAVGSITALAGEIILEGVDFGLVLDANGEVLQLIPQYPDFFRPQTTAWGHYTRKNRGKILTRAKGQQVFKPADVQPAAGPLLITASYTPALVTGWPPDLEDDLVNKVVAIAASKLTPANANA